MTLKVTDDQYGRLS